MRLLLALPPEKRPQLVRGDCAFGNDPVLTELESIGQMYLTKLRQTAGVKRLIERNWSRQDWQDVGQGSEAVEAQLKLAGWSHARRVVVVRSPPKAKPTLLESVTGKKAKRQQNLDFEDTDPVKRWYVRLAHPAARLEAITSRPLLLAGVARLTEHAGQSRLLLTLTHAAGDLIKSMVTNVRKGLDFILATAPQLTARERWAALVRYIVEKILATKPKNYVQPTLMQSKFSQPLIAAAG